MKKLTPLIFAAAFSGCASTIDRTVTADELIWSSQDDRPGWTIEEVVEQGDSITAVGVSNYAGSEAEAREAAKLKAFGAISDYLESQIEAERSGVIEGGSDEYRSNVQSYSEAILKRAKVNDVYIEQWKKDSNVFYHAFVRVELPIR